MLIGRPEFIRQPHWIVLGLAMCCFWGCGSKAPEGPELIPVTGTVRMEGQPLAGATVTFNPVSGTVGNGAFGVTDAEGKFSLTDFSGEIGCPAGDYGVTFSKITQPDGSPIPPNASRAEVGMVEQLPVFYVEFKPQTIIQGANVKAPESSFEFILDPKMKPPASFFH